MKYSLKNFDPEEVGILETKMWQAYYHHKFFLLFILIVKFIKSQSHLSYLISIRAAYHAAFAATLFRLQKGKENKNRMLKHLEKYFKIIANNSVEVFNYKRAAELELEWWFIDRYPDKYNSTREDALASLAASLYDINPAQLKEHAQYRAQAMVLDRAQATAVKNKSRAERTPADWAEIESLLKKSFSSLHAVVNSSSNIAHSHFAKATRDTVSRAER